MLFCVFQIFLLTEEKKEEEEEDIKKILYIFHDAKRRDEESSPLLWDRDSFSTFSSRRQYRGIDVTSVTFRSSPSLPVKYGGSIFFRAFTAISFHPTIKGGANI